MKYLTEDQASKKLCPMTLNNSGDYLPRCRGSDCLWWVEVHGIITREDHSDARSHMNEAAFKRGQSYSMIRREGPAGCQGVFILDAVGICGMIYKPEVKEQTR